MNTCERSEIESARGLLLRGLPTLLCQLLAFAGVRTSGTGFELRARVRFWDPGLACGSEV